MQTKRELYRPASAAWEVSGENITRRSDFKARTLFPVSSLSLSFFLIMDSMDVDIDNGLATVNDST